LDNVEILALLGGIARACGINLYGTILTLGLLLRQEVIALPDALSILADPVVLGAAGFMFAGQPGSSKIDIMVMQNVTTDRSPILISTGNLDALV
jgi:hypothetical protein